MEITNISSNKKWLLGIQKSKSPVEIGYFEKAQDKLHYHNKVSEYYLLFSGQMKIIINHKELILKQGSILFIQPKEKHQVINTSKDLKCFLVKWPHLPDDKVIC